MQLPTLFLRKRIRIIFRTDPSLQVGLIAHFEFQRTAFQQVSVTQVVFGIFISVDLKRLYIDILRTVVSGIDRQRVSVFKMQNGFLEQGSAQYIFVRTRTNRIEAHSRENIAWEGGLLATANYIQIAFDENNLVLGGFGHQFDSSKSIAAKVLWATISGGHQSWTHTGTTAKAEDHNVNKSRTIRCIKTSPAFIIEE